MTYNWLLFDADGTLFDYEAAEAKSLQAAFADYDLPFSTVESETYRDINTAVWQEFEQGNITSERLRIYRFERLFAALQLDVDAAQFSRTYLHHLGNSVDLIAGALELLAKINGRYHLALITNGLADVQRSRLAQSPLQPYFEAVVISDEVGVAKPDPAIFDIIFTQMGNPAKEEVLIIGDSLTSDMQGGINYGIATCWYNPTGKPRPDTPPITYEIEHLTDLLEVLASNE